MDLLTAFRTADVIEAAKRPSRDIVYVAPLPVSGVPDDGMLKYSTVSELKDLFGGVEPGHCFLFSEDADSLAVLKVINDHPNILPFGARRLEGLVAVEYPATFLRDSWALESEQYHTILSQRAERKHEEVAAQKEVAAKSTFHREQQARTRLSGNQRRHTAFDVVRAETHAEDPDVGAVEE